MNKKKCEYQKKLNAYIDGELKEVEFEKVRNHLKSCHLCQNELREINRINDFLFNYKEEEVNEYINQRILGTVKTLPEKRTWGLLARRVVNYSIAASVIISFTVGIILSNNLFANNNETNIEFGQESLYSFFEGE